MKVRLPIIKSVYPFCRAFLVPALFVTLALMAAAQGTEAAAAKVTALIPRDVPPTYFLDKKTGRAAGFAVDVMNKIAERSGLEVEYLYGDNWSDIFEKMKRGEADLVPDFGMTPERQKILHYGPPLETFQISYFVRSKRGGVHELSDGMSMGVMSGSIPNEILRQHPTFRLVRFDSYQHALFDLLAGRIDAVAGPVPTIITMARESGVEDKIKEIGPPFSEVKRAIAVRKDNVPLITLLNKATEDFVASAEYRQLYIKWYGKPTPFWTSGRILLASGVVLFLCIGAMMLWRYLSILKLNRELIRHIRERKEMEEALRMNRDFTERILDTVDEGFIVVDPDYRILQANNAFRDQVHMPVQEIIGKHCYEISHRRDKPCYLYGEGCSVRDAFEKGQPSSYLHEHINTDGTILYAETRSYPLKDATGTVTSAIEVINNVTHKHLLEEQLLRAHKLEAIGLLAGGIAHDFNNLLQGVFGGISLAKTMLRKEENAYQTLETTEGALNQATNLTKQLLTFSKGGAPVKKIISLPSVISNGLKFALSGSNVSCSATIADDLWPVEADEGQLNQVIHNIVLNAIEVMPDGGTIRLAAENVALGQKSFLPLKKGNYVRITIEDSGSGIDAAHISRIFDPYFTTKQKGNGLGLATSHSIIKNHGGVIDVSSRIGIGTTFSLYLPASESKPPQAARKNRNLVSGKGRILIMDDEQVVRDTAAKMVQALGYKVECAEHGEQAIEKYAAGLKTGMPFDAVILDLTVRGGMGGEETIRKMREMNAVIKATVSSGYSEDDVMANYRQYGFQAVLTKPYTIEALSSMLHTLLNTGT